jgi:small glutamine-rich tetratricopeptide repeat-containing protein alpha
VDPDSPADQSQFSLRPASLLTILDVFLKTRAKSQSSPSSAPEASTSAPPLGPSAADKATAETLKVKGNALMSQKLYDSAIEQYTEAIKIDPTPVFYSNRAAAWGGLGEHVKAAEDAQSALNIDPKFAKAYSRLG